MSNPSRIHALLSRVITERMNQPYWKTQGTTHIYGYDNMNNRFVSTAIVFFNDEEDQFDVYGIDAATGNETYVDSTADLVKAREWAMNT